MKWPTDRLGFGCHALVSYLYFPGKPDLLPIQNRQGKVQLSSENHRFR